MGVVIFPGEFRDWIRVATMRLSRTIPGVPNDRRLRPPAKLLVWEKKRLSLFRISKPEKFYIEFSQCRLSSFFFCSIDSYRSIVRKDWKIFRIDWWRVVSKLVFNRSKFSWNLGWYFRIEMRVVNKSKSTCKVKGTSIFFRDRYTMCLK